MRSGVRFGFDGIYPFPSSCSGKRRTKRSKQKTHPETVPEVGLGPV
jgi:hypothetical protein